MTNINIDRLHLEFAEHPDRNFVNYLCSSLEFGFDTLVTYESINSYECKNALSARKNPLVVDELLYTEIQRGYVKGPYPSPPFENYRVSPLGIATHKYSGKKRLIFDLSSPHNNAEPSINELINKDLCTLSYVRIDDAIEKIQDYGVGSILCKTDMTDAFKQIPIVPSQYHLFCFKWRNSYFYYVRLPFGCRSSPKLFDNLSTAICWIAKNNYGVDAIFHLLDDFLTIDKPDACGDRTMALLCTIFHRLRLPLSEKKTIGPTCELEYLGIILDTDKMQARLPREKIDRISQFILQILSQKSCTRKDLEQLLGHLNFASRVILPGRSFVSYLYKLMSSVKESYHHVYLNQECKADLHMWLTFLKNWNGISMFYDNFKVNAYDMELFTDASSTLGFGGYFQGHWFNSKWPEDLPSVVDSKLSMALLELYPIVVACILWGDRWCGKRIVFYCDNQAVVHIISKGRSKEPTIMKFMRRLTMCAAHNNFAVYSTYIPGVQNEIADSLSRFQMDRFRQLAPDADNLSTPCPPLKKVIWTVS